MSWGKGTTNNSIGWGKGADNNGIGWGSVYPESNSGDTDIQSGLSNTVAPVISGTNEVGETLSCTTGTWSGGTPITYAYQWKRDGVSIGSATNSTYLLISADAETDITCTVTATNAEGSNSATSNTITIAAEYSYLVDDYSPTVAYSLRKISSTATKAIRVRRSSDNAEQDIGFNGVGLDTSALTSFVGANNGFVTMWYNQGTSGSTYDSYQVTASDQPKIVVSGSLILDGGLPAITSDVLSMGLVVDSATIKTAFSVAKITSQTIVNYLIGTSSGGLGYNGSAGGVNGLFGYDGTNVASITGEDLNRHLGYFNMKSSKLYISKDGNLETDSGTFASSFNVNFITNRSGQTSNSLSQEYILFNSDQTSNKSAIETEINSYYAIY